MFLRCGVCCCFSRSCGRWAGRSWGSSRRFRACSISRFCDAGSACLYSPHSPARGARRWCSVCRQEIAGLHPGAADSYLAWRLGYLFGVANGLVIVEEGEPKDIESVIKDWRPVTKALGVPELVPMDFSEPDEAAWEYARNLADDPQCVAAAFESRYSPRFAALYRFGAAIAAATVFRRKALQIGAVWEPEIETYGKGALVPDALWRPMLQPVTSSGSEVQAITDRIGVHIKGNP